MYIFSRLQVLLIKLEKNFKNLSHLKICSVTDFKTLMVLRNKSQFVIFSIQLAYILESSHKATSKKCEHVKVKSPHLMRG